MGLFDVNDFALFDQYGGKTQVGPPDKPQRQLREVYDKLGSIIDGLRKLGYNCNIRKMALAQAGQGVMKYAPYHWSQVYPADNTMCNECWEKAFVVVGSTEEGLNIHIDAYFSKGHTLSDEAEKIKRDTWLQLTPQEAAGYELDELVDMVDSYYREHWEDYLRFGKEFNIKACIDQLNNMEIKKLLLGNHNLVLTGAPGTGKTYLAKQVAKSLGAKHLLVQFHPSFDYTDFVEGLRPMPSGGFCREDGVLKKLCKEAIEHPEDNFVLIIDEINRGEISKIFGELFFAIDPGYRGEEGKVRTQYQNLVAADDPFADGFYVPKNLYIIGTMNDIDRSVESMDFAMRRRFAWKEIKAEDRQSMLDDATAWGDDGKPNEAIIAELKTRMNNLNACIIDQYGTDSLTSKNKIGLTRAYQIGASYFLKYAKYNNFDDLWALHLEGLLYEYLRGTPNIEDKIERLRNAYNDTEAH